MRTDNARGVQIRDKPLGSTLLLRPLRRTRRAPRMDSATQGTPSKTARWEPLSAIERRIVGVLIEKAKTTPDQYPLSLNAIRTGCNQKSNRFPAMELEEEQLYPPLERLRSVGAITLVQSGGRIERYRHQMYEWLLVDKIELAVMAELLLRGAQTEGELRGRASRMEEISDLSKLREILDRLKAKNLVVSLTREGRGHVVTHNLYRPEELEKLRRQHPDTGPEPEPAAREREPAQYRADAPHRAEAAPASAATDGALAALEAEVAQLRQEAAAARESIDSLHAEIEKCRDEIRDLREAIGA